MAETDKKDGRAHNDGTKSLRAGDGGQTTIKPDEGLAQAPLDTDLHELQDKFPSAKVVSVKRFTADRRWESLGSVPMDILDDDYLVNEFGPGLYTLYLRDDRGKMLGGTASIRIGERATRGKPFAVPAGGALSSSMDAPPNRTSHEVELLKSEVELFKSELQRRDEMIYRMLDALSARSAAPPAAQAPPITILDMLTAFEKFQKLGQAAPVPLPEKLMDSLWKMATAKVQAADTDSDGFVPGLLRDVWDIVKPTVMQLAAPAAAPVIPPSLAPAGPAGEPAGAAILPAPAAAGSPPAAGTAPIPEEEELETVNIDLDPWISDLKTQCKAGRPVELVASVIKQHCEASEDVAAITEEVVTGDFEAFLRLDPELGAPAIRAWFQKLFEVVRVQLVGSAPDSAGAGRNGTNT